VDFRWNEWTAEHVGQHGIEPEAAEHVVEEAKDEDGSAYVLHARSLTEREKRRYRRQRR
jgi:hypothetical protein